MLLILSFGGSVSVAQDNREDIQGKVSFITTNNVYVKFEDTRSMSVGDTLFVSNGNSLVPCLVVNNKSSMSCVATVLGGCKVNTGDPIVFTKRDRRPTQSVPSEKIVVVPENRQPSDKPQTRIRGSISAAGYSSISSLRDDSYRTMYRLSLTAPHINDSRFSLEMYMNYRQTFLSNDSATVRPKDQFDVYTLAVRYDLDSTSTITLGRRINSKVSSVGAIDGLQVEKYFGNFYAGLIGGFRPDIVEYTFNPDLLQYGGYVGFQSDAQVFSGQTTLGFLEQKNKGNTDRRYLYFQQSAAIGEKVNLFSSFEFDLYNQLDGQSVRDPGFTNLVISARYRMSNRVDINLSYDSRKRIFYYETFRTEIERMLDDDIARQGVRLQVNARPYKGVSAGVSYSKRFQSNDQNKSDNMNGYVTLTKVPYTGGRVSVNYNRNTSLYLRTDILSFRYSQSFVNMKLDASAYFRMAGYTYLEQEITNDQRYYGIEMSYRIARKLQLAVLGEMATLVSEDNYRVNARIVKHF